MRWANSQEIAGALWNRYAGESVGQATALSLPDITALDDETMVDRRKVSCHI
jgi:hypothetical protein